MSEHETPFSQQLAYLNGGAHDRALTEELEKCVEALEARGGKAELTLKISLKQWKATGRVMVEVDISSKLPKLDRVGDILYVDGGQLVRQDPNQRTLDLKSIDESRPVRSLDDEPEENRA